MTIHIHNAREHNLQGVSVEIGPGLTVVTGVSGSGKTSLVFDTLYHEARRRFLDVFAVGATARLAPAEVESITGLGPTVAVGQNLLNRNPNSTLATASGLHPFLRLLFAHFGARRCPGCGRGIQVLSQDEVLGRILALAEREALQITAPLVQGAVGSHRTLLAWLGEHFAAGDLLVDGRPYSGGPYSTAEAEPEASAEPGLDPRQAHTIAVVTGRLAAGAGPAEARQAVRAAADLAAQAVVVQSVSGEQVLAWAAVCPGCGEWLADLRPVDFNAAELAPHAAAVRWEGRSFPELLALSVDEAAPLFAGQPPAAARLVDEIGRRLAALQRVGLGYLGLDRPAPSLSRGEAQRVRLAQALISRLEDMLHVLDEPTIGLHPADVQRLLPALHGLAGPVVFVEHDRAAAVGADQAIDLGPAAGPHGGQVVFAGTPHELWQAETATGRFFSRRSRLALPAPRPAPERFLTLRGVHLRNLQGFDAAFPLGRLTAVTGVSGSGKSTLVEDVLVASLAAGRPSGCREMDGPALKAVLVDQSPIGRNPRSNPATYTDLAGVLRDLFAAATGLPAGHFTFNRPEGACPACNGLGAIEVAMRYLPAVWVTCSECGGQRFSDEVLARTVDFGGQRLNIAEFLALPVSQARRLLAAAGGAGNTGGAEKAGGLEDAERILAALVDIGLGYLSLGQPSPSLSGGEAQRVKLARYLGRRSLAGQLLVLDEPSTGLHPQDLAGLLTVLDRLVRAGATVVVVEHNTDLIRAADWVLDLGPGAGPHGGRLLYAGPPGGLMNTPGSLTGRALAEEDSLQPPAPESQPGGASPQRAPTAAISIRGAASHNLQRVDVDIPKAALTVVTGLSGSGKSSLVSDVLESEARRRFLETLSLYERQGTHEGPEAAVDSLTGLGVALSVAPERLVYAQRATVGSATEISHHLAVLLAGLGQRACLACGARMQRIQEGWLCPACAATAPLAQPRHFSPATYAAACQACHGVGSRQAPQPEKLIIRPDLPLCAGAMYSPGFFPNGYLGKPYNQGYYMLQALGRRHGFDPHTTPWNQLSPAAQQAFLFGDPEPLEVSFESRTGRSGVRQLAFPGFYGFVADWDVGGTYTSTQPCPACGGARLRREYLAVTLAGLNAHQLSELPLDRLAAALEGLALPPAAGPESPADGAPVAGLLAASLQAVRTRLHFLAAVGLGYLQLGRVAGTLSAGEVQRIRLAGLLGSGLTALTLLLDEPTRGLHPREVSALLAALHALRDAGNTVIVVEHDPLVIAAADWVIDMGPGAGRLGGQVVDQGPPAALTRDGQGLTAAWLRGDRSAPQTGPRRQPRGWLTVRGARANNLQGETVRFPLGVLAGVCGVSGSGKSSLVIDTLGRALAPAKQTTSVAYAPVTPGEHEAIEGAPKRVVLVDQSRAGLGSPANCLDIAAPLRRRFAASPDAQALGLDEAALAPRCSACKGQGYTSLDMAFLPDVRVACETCAGTGYLAEAWQVRVAGLALPEVFALTIDEVYERFGDDEALRRPLQAARDVGLGYLVLRQPGLALSGGEAQRLKIANELSRKDPAGALYLLDEPSVGQHLEDVQRLVAVLHRLTAAGGSVIVVEHHTHVLAACDWLVELGPGGGPDGGRLIASGPPETLAAGSTPTAPYLRAVLEAGQ